MSTICTTSATSLLHSYFKQVFKYFVLFQQEADMVTCGLWMRLEQTVRWLPRPNLCQGCLLDCCVDTPTGLAWSAEHAELSARALVLTSAPAYLYNYTHIHMSLCSSCSSRLCRGGRGLAVFLWAGELHWAECSWPVSKLNEGRNRAEPQRSHGRLQRLQSPAFIVPMIGSKSIDWCWPNIFVLYIHICS